MEQLRKPTFGGFESEEPPRASTHNAASWMQDNIEFIGDTPLNQLCITGSHDSGMSVFSSGTPFASECNTLTQTNGIYGQLTYGTRYFDIRPVITKAHYYTGHYQNINIKKEVDGKAPLLSHVNLPKVSKNTWQGANGQSIESIIDDINQFTSKNNELVILNLSHSRNTDKDNSKYQTFDNGEWEGLFDNLAKLNFRFSSESGTKLETLTLNTFIADSAAVLIICEQGGNAIQDQYKGKGFFKFDCFSVVNKYSGNNNVDQMASDQFAKMRRYCGNYFLLSWTLTQSVKQVLGCKGGVAPDIKDLANQANSQLSERVLNEVKGPSYPNIIYTDNITSDVASQVAMELNHRRASKNPNLAALCQSTDHGPALVSYQNSLRLGWKGNDNTMLNLLSSENGLDWMGKTHPSDQASDTTPAFASIGNTLYMAWKGAGNNDLNVMSSTNGGNSWENKVHPLNQATDAAPSLAAMGNTLYLAWKGAGNTSLNVISSTDGINWHNKVHPGNQASDAAPALTSMGNKLYIAWKGAGNDSLNIMSSADGIHWGDKAHPNNETSNIAPALGSVANNIFLAWKGSTNQHLNIIESSNGVNWNNKRTINHSTNCQPTLAALNDALLLAWADVHGFLHVLKNP